MGGACNVDGDEQLPPCESDRQHLLGEWKVGKILFALLQRSAFSRSSSVLLQLQHSLL